MVRGDVAPVLHGAPARPRFNAVDRGVPDLLTPNGVLEAERATIVHHPLGNLAARRSGDLCHPSQSVPIHLVRARRGKDRKRMGSQTYTTAVGAHKVDCLSAAMVRRTRAGAVAGAVDLPHPPRPRSNNLLGAVDSGHLAGADSRVGRGRVPPKSRRSRGTALHLSGTGAQARDETAGAVARPPAVARAGVGTARLAAALNVCGIGWACARDAHAAGGGALARGDANAWSEMVSNRPPG